MNEVLPAGGRISDVTPASLARKSPRGGRRAARRARDGALKFKQARARETDEIEVAHGNGGDTP